MNKEMVDLIALRWSHNSETRTNEKHTYKLQTKENQKDLSSSRRVGTQTATASPTLTME